MATHRTPRWRPSCARLTALVVKIDERDDHLMELIEEQRATTTELKEFNRQQLDINKDVSTTLARVEDARVAHDPSVWQRHRGVGGQVRSIGEQLSTLREQQGLTQEDVAQRAKVPLHTIRRLEGGDRAYVRAAVLERIAGALDVSLDVLLDGRRRGRRTSRHSARKRVRST